MPSILDVMNTNLVIGVLSFLGVFLTAVFTFLYQRKSAKETSLNKFVDSALSGYKDLKDRLSVVEKELIEERSTNRRNDSEIEKLREKNHNLLGKVQELVSKQDLHADDIRRQHEIEIEQIKAQHRREIENLTERVKHLEERLSKYEKNPK